MEKKKKNLKQGFTLLELLVVVLIIGILTAIALPQYKYAVAKSKYATLKNVTKSLKQAVDRYYLANITYPTQIEDLDINFEITRTYRGSGDSFYIEFPGVRDCEIYYSLNNHNVICSNTILGKTMKYAQGAYPMTSKNCTAYSIDTNDILNKLCQRETDNTADQAVCTNKYCTYNY